MSKIKIFKYIYSSLNFMPSLSFVAFSLIAASTLLHIPKSYAEPVDPSTTSVTCKDGSTQTATRASTSFTTADYDKACSSHGGYEVPVSDTSSTLTDSGKPLATGDIPGKYQCGKGDHNVVHVSFNFGCVGGDTNKFTGANLNPIIDIAFALFRFLSAGVGLIVIGSIVIAGIQYTVSRGEPQVTGAAIKRITNSLIALLIYIFMFAIANFIVPGGMFI